MSTAGPPQGDHAPGRGVVKHTQWRALGVTQ